MRRLALGTLVLLSLTGCQSRKSIAASEPAPDFELKDLTGKSVRLSSFRGHPVMLDFWATWCGPCQMSIPMVQRFYKEHGDKGLVVLGLSVDEDPSGVYSFVKNFKMTYPILFAGGSSAQEAYHVEGIPTFIFIDAEGRMASRYEGFRYDMVEAWEYDFQRLTGTKK